MTLILARFYTIIKSIMARATQCNAVIYVKSQFRIVFIGLRMVSYQRSQVVFATKNTLKIVSLENHRTPILISPIMSPLLGRFAYNSLTTFRPFSLANLFTSRFVGAEPRAKSSFAFFIWIFVVKFVTLFTVLINTTFGHQYKFMIGYR